MEKRICKPRAKFVCMSVREEKQQFLRYMKNVNLPFKKDEVLRTFPGSGLETSPGKGFKDVSWRTSLEGLLEDVFRTSPGRRLANVLKKDRRDFHLRPI